MEIHRTDLAEHLFSLMARLTAAGRLLSLDRARRFEELDALAQDPDLWKDPQSGAQVMKERAALRPFAAQWAEWRRLEQTLQALMELAQQASEPSSLQEEARRLDQEIGALEALAAGTGALPGVQARAVNLREPAQTFLIVCEGAKTEPGYFKAFRLPSAEVRIVGAGANTKGLVAEAIRLRNQEEEDRDQYWCVFDRDSFPAQHFNDALEQARRNGFQVAYSNECFEIWYLLHFDYHDAAMDRSEYWPKLGAYLEAPYKKNSRDMYALLVPRQPTALRNAERLLEQYQPQHNPEKDNPCTTVHQLVNQLNEQLRRRQRP